MELDVVHLVVANDPWQKSSLRSITPASVRLEMVRAAVADVEGLEVSDVEIRRGGPSYTIDTVEWARGRDASSATRAQVTNGEDHVVLILGSDAASRMPTWHRAEELARMVEIAVISRPGGAEWAGLPPGWDWRHVSTTPLQISSTDIRSRVAERRSVRFRVPDSVLRIIDERGLYAAR